MPTDYLQILRGITGGLEAGQNFRANRQLERAREQQLESDQYKLEGRRGVRSFFDPKAASYDPTLEDPFAFKLFDWFKQKTGNRKRKSALSGEEIEQIFAPTSGMEEESPENVSGPLYADGGKIDDETLRRKLASSKLSEIPDPGREDESARDFSQTLSDERARNRSAAAREYLERTDAAAARKKAIDDEPSAISFSKEGRARNRADNAEFFSGLKERLFGGEEQAAPAPAAPPAPRTALPVAQTPARPAAQATQGVATASGTTQPAGRARSPVQPQASNLVDFSKIEADPKEVPNMTTTDWVDYRKRLIEAVSKSGRIEDVERANDYVTKMQQQGFLSYGQQGLALQQAGNLKGAMAAYRAAFQYFPNGNDVEFGLIKDAQGQRQIVGFGRDEKTGKIVEGSQIVMNPEQAARLLENFTKPEAFRAWTKDWRDFKEGKRRFDAQLANKQGDDAFRERRYNEVEKPLAQAQADSLANNSEAAILRAERAGQSALRPRDLQGSERTFRERLDLVGRTDEDQKDYLASVMSQIKTSNPQTPDNVIIQAVMKAHEDGTLPQRLKAMGIE